MSLHTQSQAQWQSQGAYCLECGLAPQGFELGWNVQTLVHKSSPKCLFQMGKEKGAKRLSQKDCRFVF